MRERNSNLNSAAASHEEEVVQGEGEGNGVGSKFGRKRDKNNKRDQAYNIRDENDTLFISAFDGDFATSTFEEETLSEIPKNHSITLFSKVGKKNSGAKVVHQSFLMHLTAILLLLVLEKDILLKLISQK